MKYKHKEIFIMDKKVIKNEEAEAVKLPDQKLKDAVGGVIIITSGQGNPTGIELPPVEDED